MKSKLNGLLSAAVRLTEKREHYCKHMKPCPECGTNQVQLTNWTDDAEWKCRHCRHKWSGI